MNTWTSTETTQKDYSTALPVGGMVKAPVISLQHQVPNPIANGANMEKELRDGEKHGLKP